MIVIKWFGGNGHSKLVRAIDQYLQIFDHVSGGVGICIVKGNDDWDIAINDRKRACRDLFTNAAELVQHV